MFHYGKHRNEIFPTFCFQIVFNQILYIDAKLCEFYLLVEVNLSEKLTCSQTIKTCSWGETV